MRIRIHSPSRPFSTMRPIVSNATNARLSSARCARQLHITLDSPVRSFRRARTARSADTAQSLWMHDCRMKAVKLSRTFVLPKSAQKDSKMPVLRCYHVAILVPAHAMTKNVLHASLRSARRSHCPSSRDNVVMTTATSASLRV